MNDEVIEILESAKLNFKNAERMIPTLGNHPIYSLAKLQLEEGIKLCYKELNLKRTVRFKVVKWQPMVNEFRTLLTVETYEQAEAFIHEYPEDEELQIHKVYVKESRSRQGNEL